MEPIIEEVNTDPISIFACTVEQPAKSIVDLFNPIYPDDHDTD